MALPPKRHENDTHQRDINDLIQWCDDLLISGGGVPATRTLTAGDGLTGGGDLTADRTFNLGTPGTISASSSNAVSADSHTHAVSGLEPTVSKGNLTAGSAKIAIGGTGTSAVIGAGASVDVNEGNLTHNNIGSLQGGAPGQYNHLTDAQVGALHTAITLKDGHDAALSLSGQELDLADVLTPTEHTAIGDSAPHHAAATAGNGISITGQQVAIDPTDGNTWTGAQLFQGANTYRQLTPEASETYDVGAYDKLWRTGYLSNIMATVFAENTIQLIGGEFLIPKDTGLLPAVASGDSTIDFGKSMTPDDHILIKSQTTSGAYVTEYIKVGSLVSGTTYNVTRDEASATTPDPAWPNGTPYAALGQTGNGYLDLSATTTPRLSIFSQGANYNSQTEVVRLGDINGLGGITSTTWGAYFGATDKAYLTVDPTNGLQIKDSNDAIAIDESGITFHSWGWLGTLIPENPPPLASSSLRWYDEEGNLKITLSAGEEVLGDELFLSAGMDVNKFNCRSTAIFNNTITYWGNLQSYKNSTAYTGYIYVPCNPPLTSTSWDGDSYSDKTTTLIDLSAVFGAPAGIKAVVLRVLARDSVAVHTDPTIRMDFSNVGTGTWTHAVWPQGGDFWYEAEITVPCNADGDIYYDINASGAGTFDVHIQILGYYI